MKKLASGSSINKAWEIIHHIESVTRSWKPKCLFVVVMTKPDAVEIWTKEGYPPTPRDWNDIKAIMRQYLESNKEMVL